MTETKAKESSPIETRQIADRRGVRFMTIAEILGEAERLDGAARIRSTGNWTPAQNIDHIADVIVCVTEGEAS